MKHRGIYFKTTFEEMEILSKGTKFENKKIYLFLNELTAAPIISIFMALLLGFKFKWDKIYINLAQNN